MTSIDQTLDTKPWYRYPWTWFLITVPLLTIIACIITIVLAVKSSSGLVSDDYYKDGLAINKSFVRDKNAMKLDLSSFVGLLPGRDAVVLQVNGDHLELPLTLKFLHATRKNEDQIYEIRSLSHNQAKIDIRPLVPGKWYVRLESAKGNWRLKGLLHFPAETDVELLPRL